MMELEQITIMSSKSSATFSSDSQLLNVANFADLMVSAFNSLNFTVRNDVLLSDSELLFRNQHFFLFSFVSSVFQQEMQASS